MGLAICVDQTARFYSRKETNMFLATLDAGGPGTSVLDTTTLAIIILVSSLVGLVGFIFAIIVMLCVLAFGEWPIYKELNYLRQMAARGPQYQPPPQQSSSSPQYPQYGQPQPPQYPQG